MLDLDALATLAPVVPIITNREALAVNQAWAGSPGQLLLSIDPDNPDGQPDAAGMLPHALRPPFLTWPSPR